MIEAYELAVLILPEDLFYEVIFLFIPCLEVVLYKAAGITGIGIKAPESMVEMALSNKLSEVFHPLQIIAFHEAAPLTYEDGRDVIFRDIEPVVVPCILIERFICETALEPGLFVDSRTVIVRRINDLFVAFRTAEIYRIILDSHEVCAPPGVVVIVIVVFGNEVVRLDVFRIDLDAFDDDESIWILVQNGIAGNLCDPLPVVHIV